MPVCIGSIGGAGPGFVGMPTRGAAGTKARAGVEGEAGGKSGGKSARVGSEVKPVEL